MIKVAFNFPSLSTTITTSKAWMEARCPQLHAQKDRHPERNYAPLFANASAGAQTISVEDAVIEDTTTIDSKPNLQRSPPTRRFRLALNRVALAFKSDAVTVNVNQDCGTVIKTRKWWSFSLRRFGRKAAVVANVGASVAEAVPVLGAPVKGALEASIKVHTILEKRCQNVEAIQQLVCKLKCLEEQLCRHSKSTLDEWMIHYGPPIPSFSNEILTWLLGTMKEGIGTLERQSAEIKQQNEEIKRQNDLHTTLLQAIFMGQASSLGPTILSFSIRVVDPWGVQHPFLHIPCSFNALCDELLSRYSKDERRRPILERYLTLNLFELARDSGRELTLVTERDLVTLEKDSTLIMSVVTFMKVTVGGVQCPLCQNYIVLSLEDSGERVYCGTCDKNVQVGRGDDADGADDVDGFEGEDLLPDIRQIVIKAMVVSHDESTPVSDIAPISKASTIVGAPGPLSATPATHPNAPGPNATEEELITWKRQQNTLAARKSRQRKLEHMRLLEQSVEDWTKERDAWKTRALTLKQLLASHGIVVDAKFED
ncbi:hypothetical protein NMY22_g9525 [Coprinellus aureogranulatus]|nr:hypothetical protein NMY22_g9525 [Coprinellus aureogranulatus]